MHITKLLIEPALKHIESELNDLASRVSHDKKFFTHNQKLMVEICGLLSELGLLKERVFHFNAENQSVIPDTFYEELKRVKRDVHFSRRTFLKLKSNEARLAKMISRRNDVSTVAA